MTRMPLRGWKFALAAAFVGGAAFLCTVAVGLHVSGPALPSFGEVRASYRLSDAVLTDRHGSVIHEMRVDSTGRRLDWIGLADISPALTGAVVAAEDRRFHEHGGVDWRALGTALARHVASGGSRGASTISMQLASRLDTTASPRGAKRNLREKLRQISAALALERGWSKGEILEAYLNLITFRGELQGIAAAARGLFDKDPSGLSETESLILASLIPSSRPSADALARRAVRLAARTQSAITADEVAALAAETLGRPYRIRPQVALAPHVARMLLTGEGQRAQCTLDGSIQLFAVEALNQQLGQLRERNVRDGAVLVVDNATGDIIAYAANQGSTSSAPHVDGIRALRQAGSTLKPFLYGLAIEKEFLTAASILEDSPLQIPTAGGLYVPENYDREFLGSVSLRTALSASLNIPAVRTLMLVTPDAFVERLRALGMTSLEREADYYGYSLALGSADVSLHELVNAYRTLANRGRWGAMRIAAGGEAPAGPVPVMDARAAFIVSAILSDREARSATFGLENPLATRFWTAVKTGTSKDMRDNWCVGYSERYTVGVWVGNFSGEPMWNVSGMAGAAPVWLDVMNHLHRRTASKAPKAAPGVVQRQVAFRGNLEPPRTEWFIAGTQPEEAIVLERQHGIARIVYPQPATIITLDPDIPAELQWVSFVGRFAEDAYEWRLDEKAIGSSASLPWKPERGRHVLSLVDRERNVVDSVIFIVK